MKRVLAATALALVGFAPAISTACEYNDASSASAAPPSQLASAPTPAATMVPTQKVANALAPKAVKPTVAKAKASVPDEKLAAVTDN